MRIAQRALCLTALLAALHLPSRADASEVRIGLGADYWLTGQGVFNFHLALGANLARAVIVGGRFGALFTSTPTIAGIPADLYVRFDIPRAPIYFEVNGGPWILITGAPVRGHFAAGLGFKTGRFSFGFEGGYLQPNALLGARMGYRF